MPSKTHNPRHYDVPGTSVQLIDVLKASACEFEDPWAFFLWASVLQYVIRYHRKGTPVDDLNKAGVYLNWLRDYYGKAPNDATPSHNVRAGEDSHNLQGGALGSDPAPVEEVHK